MKRIQQDPLRLLLLVGSLTTLGLSDLRAAHPFTKITEGAIVNDVGSWVGCAWGDYDNDGDLDLFVGNVWPGGAGNFLYENNGDGTFTRVTEGPIATETAASGRS